MYSISRRKNKWKQSTIDSINIISLDGFTMSSKSGIKVQNQIIRDIKVVNRDFAYVVVYDKVMNRYQKLIDKLAELITSDDDTGSDLDKALNEIEKFRLEIKNKYRLYLKKKELEKMSKELISLKKTAEKRRIEIYQNLKNYSNSKAR